MKLDPDYSKRLLRAFQDALRPTTNIRELEQKGLSSNDDEFEFHLCMLNDQGFVVRDGGRPGVGAERSADNKVQWSDVPLRLTASGQEFANAMCHSKAFHAVEHSGVTSMSNMRDIAVAACKATVSHLGYSANVLRVLIASPGDVPEERRIVTEELHRWNDAHSETRKIVLRPIKWETGSRPSLAMRAQAVINKQIADSADILIGIFDSRIGTPTERHPSGTVEEIRNHASANKPAMVYFSNAPLDRDFDREQYDALVKFREECKCIGLYDSYKNATEFRQKISHHITLELNDERYSQFSVAPSVTQPQPRLSSDATSLLTEAASYKPGSIFVLKDHVVIRHHAFTDGTSRSFVRWKSAVTELQQSGYVMQERSGSRHL